MDRKETLALSRFRQRLEKRIRVERMVLFGSRVRGTPGKWSDYDLLIVSPAFRNKKSWKRPLGFYRLWTLDAPVDFLCYTPEELTAFAARVSLVRKALKEGIPIA